MKYCAIFSIIFSTIFIFCLFKYDISSVSGFFGTFACSLAFAATIFFFLFAPWGRRSRGKSFGIIEHQYSFPLAYIPVKVLLVILGAILLSCAIGFGFYIYEL